LNRSSWTTLMIVALFTFGLFIQHHLKISGTLNLVDGQARSQNVALSVVHKEKNLDLTPSVKDNKRVLLDATPLFVHKKKVPHPKPAVSETKNLERKSQAVQVKRERPVEKMIASRGHNPQQELAEKHQKFLQEIRNSDVTTLDLRKPSGLNVGQADSLLKGTGLEGLGKAFVEAEKNYQVNAFYLIAHAAWESGWGKSRLSREKNNLFGFMAYDGSPYKSAKRFKSKAEGIDVVARYISQHYLDETGRYYHGPTLRGMNVRYATDQNWDRGIAKVIIYLVKKLPSVDQEQILV